MTHVSTTVASDTIWSTEQFRTVEARMAEAKRRTAELLTALLTPTHPAAPALWSAMRYSSLNGGKRLRPALVWATAECFNSHPASLDAIVTSLECLHVYSLIHDDLPAMDNDDLRRGQPTCHRQFDEATAILAGDALQALAFECVAKAPLDASVVVALLQDLAHAAGAHGMAGGQAIDLFSLGKTLTEEELKAMHRLKTGALLTASIVMPARACQANETQLKALTHFGIELGLCFQIVDDVLDVTSSTQTLGKPIGSDARSHKPTYVSILGLNTAKERAVASFERACQQLLKAELPNPQPLRDLARFVIARQN